MPSNDDFERGELFATVRNIDNNVNAVRTEMTAVSHRVTGVEQQIAADKAQREVRVQQYEEFRDDTNKKLNKLASDMQKLVVLEKSIEALRDALKAEGENRHATEDKYEKKLSEIDGKIQSLLDDKSERKGVFKSVGTIWGAILLIGGIVLTQVWTDSRLSNTPPVEASQSR